jgi:anti-sigma regulatory factor (Ser/Thr protein kinase)
VALSSVSEAKDKGLIPFPIRLQPRRSRGDHDRGIYLMRALMDEVHFEQGGTEVHMRVSKRIDLTRAT